MYFKLKKTTFSFHSFLFLFVLLYLPSTECKASSGVEQSVYGGEKAESGNKSPVSPERFRLPVKKMHNSRMACVEKAESSEQRKRWRAKWI